MSRLGVLGVKIKCSEMGIDKLNIAYRYPKASRITKVAAAISLHILLHVISVHLAVACTIIHIVQHRQAITALCRKLPRNLNSSHSQPFQPLHLTI